MEIKDDTRTLPAAAGWGSKDTAILAFLVIAGLAYYGQYYDCGFKLGDEGSVVLITSRLLAGERPFLDVDLGYGLLWYYPLVLLFKITGVSFIATRIYFLSLALATSLLAFLAIRRQTHRLGLATAVALLTLAVPGTLHKAYIPLIVTANMLFLPLPDREQRVLGRWEVLAAGLVAAVSYHIRPDLGWCAALVLMATLVTHTILQPSRWTLRLYQLGRLSTLLCAAALVPTLPLLVIARSQGFLDPFLVALYMPVSVLSEFANTIIAFMVDIARPVFGFPIALTAPPQPADSVALEEAGKRLARIPWEALWEEGPRRSFSILTYLPFLTLTIILALACFFTLRGGLRSRSMVTGSTVGVLALLGLTCSAFPQFFLFRPDVAHLSQFMPGFVVLLGVCFGLWVFPARRTAQEGADRAVLNRNAKFLARMTLGSFLILHVGLYIWFGLHDQGTGSIAAARGRTERFVSQNGVDVAVHPNTKKLYAAATRIIEENTREDDAVLCFPYCPGFNIMTRRRTLMRRLYVDDSMLILEPDWQQRMIEQVDDEQVPLIIIDDLAINGTEISRFKNWATDFMVFIRADYELVESFSKFEFYVRKKRRLVATSLVLHDSKPDR